MADESLADYTDPLFFYFPVLSALLSMVSFMLFAIPMTWIAMRDPEEYSTQRIQSRRARAQELLWPSLTNGSRITF